MPRYHFNVLDGVSRPDLGGIELEKLDVARLEAVRLSGELLRDHPEAFLIQTEWRIEITDQSGLILFAVHISAVAVPALPDWRPPLKHFAKC